MNLVTTSSMSSREIAELTGKRHDHVLRDIRAMVSQVHDLEDNPSLGYQGIQGVIVETDEQTKRTSAIHLDKDHTLALLTGYDAKARFRVIKRWQELESNQPAIPRTYSEALQLAADQARKIEEQTLQIEAAKPAVEFHERVAVAEDGHAIDEAAKILRVGPHKLRKWMREVGILRLDGLPAAEMMNRGYFRVIEKTIEIGHGFKLYRQSFVTGKGMQFLQRRIDRTLMGVDV